jgi:hypothetical protein
MVNPTYAKTKYVDTTRPRASGGARRLAVDRLPMKIAPTATPPTTVPIRNRAIEACDSPPTISARATRRMPSPDSTTGRVANRLRRTAATAAEANMANTTAPLTAWLC